MAWQCFNAYRFPLAGLGANAWSLQGTAICPDHDVRPNEPGATFNTLPSLKRTLMADFDALKAR